MAAPHRSKISWTDYSGGDANFVTGCTPVSPGCANCYARAIYERFGRDFSQVEWHVEKLERLGRWKAQPPEGRRRARVFVCDTGDLFHPDVPDEFIIGALYRLAFHAGAVDWQILTKRPWRMLERVQRFLSDGVPRVCGMTELPAHVWLGVTAENQETANERIPLLLQTPAAVRFVSVEPMLEPMNLSYYMQLSGSSTAGPWRDALGRHRGGGGIGGQMMSSCPSHDIHWVICGAESGPNRRPFDVQWAVDLYYQCREARVPYFYKQSGGVRPGFNPYMPGVGRVQEWPDA